MKKVSIFLAEGFEEVEALTPADLLRRAGAEVTLVSIKAEKTVTGSHGISITADRLFEEMDYEDADLLVLDENLDINSLFARGKVAVWEQEVKMKGRFEQ